VNVVDEHARVVLNRRVLFNTLSNYAGKSINLIAWFFLTPFILKQLGASMYGLWVLVGSIVAYGTLLDFGIAGAVTKYVAEFRAKGEVDLLGRLVATALWIYTAIGFTVVLLALAIAPFFPAWFSIAPEQHQTAYWLVVISGIGIGISIPSTTLPAVLRGLQRFDLINITVVLHTILQTGATILILLMGGGALGVVGVTIVVKLIMLVPMIYLVHKVAPDLKFGWRGADRKLLRKVATFSSALFLINVGGQLETKTDEVVIGAFMPVMAVTPYNLARRLSSLPQSLTEQFLSQLLPLASQIHAENNPNKLQSLFLVSTRLTLALLLPFGFILIILSRPLLAWWVGEEYAVYAPLVAILTLATMIDTSIWPAGSILQGMARHRLIAVLALGAGIVNLILSVVLVRYIGLTGVALGTLIPTTVVCLGVILPYTTRLVGVSWSRVINEILLPALLPAVPAALTLYLLTEAVRMPSIFLMVLFAALSAVIYLAGYVSLGVNRSERLALQKVIYNVRRYAITVAKSGKIHSS
jgi:O-antigen/teichoic acid export membrane protein